MVRIFKYIIDTVVIINANVATIWDISSFTSIVTNIILVTAIASLIIITVITGSTSASRFDRSEPMAVHGSMVVCAVASYI